MKKFLLISLISILFSSCFSTKDIYRSNDFDNKTSSIKTIALLPFKVTTIGYPPRYISPIDIDINNEKLGYSFQESLYNFLVLHNSNQQKTAAKSFQSLQKTIALLKQNNISITSIYEKQPEDIAKLLGVDAVILTNVEEHKNWNEKIMDNAKMNCYIYSSDQSEPVWQTSCNGDTRLMNDTASLVEYFTNWVSKHFPFHA